MSSPRIIRGSAPSSGGVRVVGRDVQILWYRAGSSWKKSVPKTTLGTHCLLVTFIASTDSVDSKAFELQKAVDRPNACAGALPPLNSRCNMLSHSWCYESSQAKEIQGSLGLQLEMGPLLKLGQSKLPHSKKH